jgi:hypothetical protein
MRLKDFRKVGEKMKSRKRARDLPPLKVAEQATTVPIMRRRFIGLFGKAKSSPP